MSKMKDRTKRAYLSQEPKPRMRTILDPRVLKEVGSAPGKRPIVTSDYISVPAVATAGTWAMRDLLLPGQLRQLAIYTNKLAGRSGRHG